MTLSQTPEIDWNAANSLALYRVANWGEGYFGINAAGHASVRPHPDGPELDLLEVADAIERAGLRLPALLRFTDVLADRVGRLQMAFRRAAARHQYVGGYQVVYPVKVNQQRTVVEHILHSDPEVGLEAGSKPELMAVLGCTPPGRVIVCNGYKDRAFIRLAMAGSALGHRLFLVIEKPSEVDDILALAAEGGVLPRLGLRVRLASVAAGHWQNTGGDKAKFGLTANQLLSVVERLRGAGQLDTLRMLHVHVGSQVAQSAALARAMEETANLYRALRE
ncbi:MAG: arginine decarboxylase, partial [Salinisphaera sp.]|nr:arginine decarboxylase [Salinisphaera sp.]